MKIKDLNKIREWVYLQIEERAEERRNNICDWSTSSKDAPREEKEIKKWVTAKKAEFEDLLK